MPAIDAIAAWLIAVSWQLLPLTAVVIMLDLALRRAGPVVRSALWWMVLAKLIVPPGLASPLSIVQLWPQGVSSVLAATNFHEGESIELDVAVGRDERTGAPDVQGLPAKLNRASGAAMLLAVWAGGAIAAAILACWRYRRARESCLDGAEALTGPATDAHDTVAAAAVAAARQLGLPAPPPIFVAAHAAREARAAGLPAVIGFFAPCIVLPRALLERSRAEIEHVLLHELAHVRRRDPLTSLVCLVAQIIFWFHPAIWCARRRLAALREMACDRTVARVLGDATPAYRRTLILLARSTALANAAPGALGFFQRQSQLVTRLDALARPASMRRATERVAGAAIAAAILVSCVPLASSRGAPTASIDVPPLDALRGSLQKRYAVMRALALEAQAEAQAQAHPQPSR